MEKFYVDTPSQTMLINITSQVREIIAEEQFKHGICYVFVPHTTAGLTINESADPDVKSDIVTELNKIVPYQDNYQHTEGNSAAHIKSSIIGSSEIIFVENGNLQLGTWQGIFLCEFDGPRKRQVWVKLIKNN
jgi:secondary thiamine-phosphate synthase enzyme